MAVSRLKDPLIWLKVATTLEKPQPPPRADSRLAPSQWETLLQSNAVSHWLGAKLESALPTHMTGYQDRSSSIVCWMARPIYNFNIPSFVDKQFKAHSYEHTEAHTGGIQDALSHHKANGEEQVGGRDER